MSGVTNNCAVASTIIESGRSDNDNDRDTDTPIYNEARHDPRSSTSKNRKREKGNERERERERRLIDVRESDHREMKRLPLQGKLLEDR